MKNNKAAGLDFIPAELLKHGGAAMIKELTKISNQIWSSETVPTEWNTRSH